MEGRTQFSVSGVFVCGFFFCLKPIFVIHLTCDKENWTACVKGKLDCRFYRQTFQKFLSALLSLLLNFFKSYARKQAWLCNVEACVGIFPLDHAYYFFIENLFALNDLLL